MSNLVAGAIGFVIGAALTAFVVYEEFRLQLAESGDVTQ